MEGQHPTPEQPVNRSEAGISLSTKLSELAEHRALVDQKFAQVEAEATLVYRQGLFEILHMSDVSEQLTHASYQAAINKRFTNDHQTTCAPSGEAMAQFPIFEPISSEALENGYLLLDELITGLQECPGEPVVITSPKYDYSIRRLPDDPEDIFPFASDLNEFIKPESFESEVDGFRLQKQIKDLSLTVRSEYIDAFSNRSTPLHFRLKTELDDELNVISQKYLPHGRTQAFMLKGNQEIADYVNQGEWMGDDSKVELIDSLMLKLGVDIDQSEQPVRDEAIRSVINTLTDELRGFNIKSDSEIEVLDRITKPALDWLEANFHHASFTRSNALDRASHQHRGLSDEMREYLDKRMSAIQSN